MISFRKKKSMLLFIGAAACTLTSGCRPQATPVSHVPRPNLKEATLTPEVKRALESYIQEKYGWERTRYRIYLEQPADGLDVYMIGHLDDEEHIRVGGGKSFLLYFDRANLKGVREMHFQ